LFININIVTATVVTITYFAIGITKMGQKNVVIGNPKIYLRLINLHKAGIASIRNIECRYSRIGC